MLDFVHIKTNPKLNKSMKFSLQGLTTELRKRKRITKASRILLPLKILVLLIIHASLTLTEKKIHDNDIHIFEHKLKKETGRVTKDVNEKFL